MALATNRVTLIDGRWIGIGGPGRVAENLLRGLQEIAPEGRFVVWGPDRVTDLLWPGAEHIRSRHHAKAWYSQREFPGPRALGADVAYYPHQLRPGWRLAPIEITTIHDTIPFRYPGSRLMGTVTRAHFHWMARLSTLIVTDSEFSKRSLQADLRVPADRVRVLPLPIDHDGAARVRALRATVPRADRVVFLGRDAPHKNLDRLVQAMGRSAFGSGSGVLTFIGVDGPAQDRLATLATASGTTVEFPGVVDQDRLEELLASARLLVQPSLEEGFGLPAAEAIAAGIPVAVSTGGSLPEITQGQVEPFDPFDVGAIAAAIDAAIESGIVPDVTFPHPRDFAASALDAIEAARSLGTRSRR